MPSPPERQRKNFNPRSLAGATALGLSERSLSLFQSTLPRGSDILLIIIRVREGQFQSTLPRGSDEQWRMDVFATTDFNPRSLAGATHLKRKREAYRRISIHAPSRERLRPLPRRRWRQYFNPRSLAGATTCVALSAHAAGFQSTLPRGSDLRPICFIFAWSIFQSTLPRGSDLDTAAYRYEQSISIHAPSRERPHPLHCA